ncbi:MAG: class I SAM-dependent methyltransferase [Thermoplasmata archaeon]|nr:class I SAM-dependent methyltransferase [Thermoplasmata archaeon]
MGARVDWAGWLARWERQQEFHLEHREERFTAMLDLLEAVGPPQTVVDLACGPGSLSRRLLARFPSVHVVAVDFDPVLLRLGREALAPFSDRIRWVEADLRTEGWAAQFPPAGADAVVSTTALHWLTPTELSRVYRQLPRVLRAGGVFLDGDHLAYEADQPTLTAAARGVGGLRKPGHRAGEHGEDWDSWWRALALEPELHELFRERERRFPGSHHREEELSLNLHESELRRAGFREVGTIWQSFDDRVLAGFL